MFVRVASVLIPILYRALHMPPAAKRTGLGTLIIFIGFPDSLESVL